MIQNIVFDMGGVLITWSPHRIAARFDLCDGDMQLLRREVFGSVEWVWLPEGLHPAAERCVFWWKEELWPIEGMEELIRELADMGYGIYLLSNATSALHEYFPRIPGSACFRGGIVSADWKLLKPQREIYEKLFSECGLNAADCLFVDDSAANVEGALRCGMDGVVFYGDTNRLRRDLRSKGVPVREGEA